MTTYVNGFDSGSNGSAASTSTIASSGYGFTKTGAAAMTFSAADAIDGALSIETGTRASTTADIRTNGALATLDVSFSFMFLYKTTAPNANDYLYDVRTSGGDLVRMLTNGSTGVPFVQISGITQTGTIATAALVHDTQYRVDVRVHINASTGYIISDFFTPYSNVPLANLAFNLTGKNLGSSNITDIFIGPSGTNTVTVGQFVLDLVRINDAQSTSYWGSPLNTENGAADLRGLGTLTAAAVTTRPGAADLRASSTLTAISTGTGAIYDDARYTYDSGGLQYDGGGLGPSNVQAILTAVSTLTCTATVTPGTPINPVLGDLAASTIVKNGQLALKLVPTTQVDLGLTVAAEV